MTAQPGLDVNKWDLTGVGCDSAGKGGVRIALDNQGPVGVGA